MIELLHAMAAPGATVAVAAPERGEGYWAGGPCAVIADDVVCLAYRAASPGRARPRLRERGRTLG